MWHRCIPRYYILTNSAAMVKIISMSCSRLSENGANDQGDHSC